MTTWRLAAAETLLFGDALDVLLPACTRLDAAPRLAVEALRGVPIVSACAVDLVPPTQAARAAAGQAVARGGVEVELAARGAGDLRRLVWIVDWIGARGYERRTVDAWSGAVGQEAGFDGRSEPVAILLTRRRGPAQCDLAGWARSLVGLPLSVEIDGPGYAGDASPSWREVVRGAPEALAV